MLCMVTYSVVAFPTSTRLLLAVLKVSEARFSLGLVAITTPGDCEEVVVDAPSAKTATGRLVVTTSVNRTAVTYLIVKDLNGITSFLYTIPF